MAINRISAINSIFSYRIPKGVSSIHGGNSNIWLEFHPDPSGKIRPILSNIFVKWVGSTTNYCRSFFQGRAVNLPGCVIKLSDTEFSRRCYVRTDAAFLEENPEKATTKNLHILHCLQYRARRSISTLATFISAIVSKAH